MGSTCFIRTKKEKILDNINYKGVYNYGRSSYQKRVIVVDLSIALPAVGTINERTKTINDLKKMISPNKLSNTLLC